MTHLRTIFLALLLCLALAPALQAAPPTSVTLTYFRGEYRSNNVQLQWQTATELDTAGFKVKRGDSSGGPFAELGDIGIVAARGGPTNGATYEAADEAAIAGRRYWYQLIEIEYDGSEHILQAISVLADTAPTATLEGISTTDPGGDGGAPGGGATSTPAATATGAATSMATATRPAPSPSPTPSASPQPGPPTAQAPTPTIVRAVGADVVEAAQSPGATQPTAVAQSTNAHPAGAENDAVQEEPYPGATTEAGPSPTPLLIEATVEGYPFGDAPGGTEGAEREEPFGSSVGASAATTPAAGVQPTESGLLSRALLWGGFVVGLIIFVAGAATAIVLTTRKQRSNL